MYGMLNNLYWHGIFQLSVAIIVISLRKKTPDLVSGVDMEELRLYCRHMANPRNRFAEKNLHNYLKSKLKTKGDNL